MSKVNADLKGKPKFFCPLFNFRIVTTEEEKTGLTVIDGTRKEAPFTRIKFIENTTIGGLRKKDLAKRRLLDVEFDRHIATAFYDKYGYLPVIEIYDVMENNIVQFVENIVLALRLFKEGDVFCKILWSDRDSGFSVLTSTYELPSTIFFSNNELKVEEIFAVNEIFQKVIKTDFSKRRHLRIALDRLNRSYGKSMLDEKIIDFMIAFEALFLRDNTPNHGLVIGTACSLLLGKTDEERDEIYDFFVKAYALRNKIVHGSQIDFTGTKDTVLKLKGYLRKAILLLI